MKEVILHIGMHKTGTTTIQTALSQLSDPNTRYASFRQRNHSIPIFTLFSGAPWSHHHWINRGASEQEVASARREFLEILSSDLADASFDRLIISGEDMGWLTPVEQQNCCKYFHQRGHTVRVVAVLREPRSWARSANQERVKHGATTLEKLNPLYRQKLEGFLQSAGADLMCVVDYHQLQNNGGLINGFAKLLEITLAEVPHANESLSLEAVVMLMELNCVSTITTADHTKRETRSIIVDSISQFFSRVESEASLSQHEALGQISDGIANDVHWLKDTFAIDYTNSLTNNVKPPPSRALIDQIATERIQAFFHREGIKCKNRENVRPALKRLCMAKQKIIASADPQST